MKNHRGRTIVFNGEIFNWRELRRDLEAIGYHFNTQADTAVIMAAWDRWSPDYVKWIFGFCLIWFCNRARRSETVPLPESDIHAACSYLRDKLVSLGLFGTLDQRPNDLRKLTVHEACGSQLQRLLRFDDRISAAFRMKGRPVFLDPRIFNFAISLEGHHKVRNGWTKFIIRRYLERKGLSSVAWHREWTQTLLHRWVDEIQCQRIPREHPWQWC